jgi:hypothetical protein
MSKTKAERFRIMAAECERQAELATEEHEFREIQMRLASSFYALAENEDWLDGRDENRGAGTTQLAASVYEAA